MSASTVPTALIIASQLRDLRWFVESRLDNLLHGNASFRTLTLMLKLKVTLTLTLAYSPSPKA